MKGCQRGVSAAASWLGLRGRVRAPYGQAEEEEELGERRVEERQRDVGEPARERRRVSAFVGGSDEDEGTEGEIEVAIGTSWTLRRGSTSTAYGMVTEWEGEGG